MTTEPHRISFRGPSRERSHPTRGAKTLWTARKVENTPETSERLQPNSLSNATKKTEKAYHAP
jgi:hypothetical protein